MPFNGQGTFVPKHIWVIEAAANTPILPTNFDDQTSDIAAALSNCITRDGQGGPTLDIPWNNFGITNLRAPALAADAATKGYVDTVDAATRTWVGGTTQALPAQTGNAGKALITDGAQASWQLVYPVQTGNAGKALVTDGAQASWQPITPFSNTTILAQVCALSLALS